MNNLRETYYYVNKFLIRRKMFIHEYVVRRNYENRTNPHELVERKGC